MLLVTVDSCFRKSVIKRACVDGIVEFPAGTKRPLPAFIAEKMRFELSLLVAGVLATPHVLPHEISVRPRERRDTDNPNGWDPIFDGSIGMCFIFKFLKHSSHQKLSSLFK